MAFVHGKDTVIVIDGTEDLSAYINTSEISRSADSHDTTTYGSNSHKFTGGLLNGTFSMEGIYDNDGTAGPRAVLEPKIGTEVDIARYPEGDSSGKPVENFSAVLTSYVETNPVGDMVTWTAEFQISGDVTSSIVPSS